MKLQHTSFLDYIFSLKNNVHVFYCFLKPIYSNSSGNVIYYHQTLPPIKYVYLLFTETWPKAHIQMKFIFWITYGRSLNFVWIVLLHAMSCCVFPWRAELFNHLLQHVEMFHSRNSELKTIFHRAPEPLLSFEHFTMINTGSKGGREKKSTSRFL